MDCRLLCNFALAFNKECKTYCSIDSQITTARKEQTCIIGTAPTRRRFSHTYMWLVVSRESYGECLCLFCVNRVHETSKTMKKRLVMVWLTLLLVSSAAVAQNLSMFKMLSDSVYLTDAKYHALNKYQKDATVLRCRYYRTLVPLVLCFGAVTTMLWCR